MPRQPTDSYYTPSGVIEELLALPLVRHDLRDRSVQDPFAGDGRILDAIDASGLGCVVSGYELVAPSPAGRRPGVCYGFDTLKREPIRWGHTIVTNPPYRQALEAAQWCVASSACCWLLLPLAFLASARRRPWLREHPPLVYPLAKRPSFTGHGTDMRDVAWFRWSDDGISGVRFDLP